MDWRFDGLTALVSIAAKKAADLVVLAGNRAKNIDDVERVETVFKDGVGYDPATLIPNVLERNFTVARPNKVWVTDITYVRTWQGWLWVLPRFHGHI